MNAQKWRWAKAKLRRWNIFVGSLCVAFVALAFTHIRVIENVELYRSSAFLVPLGGLMVALLAICVIQFIMISLKLLRRNWRGAFEALVMFAITAAAIIMGMSIDAPTLLYAP